MISENEFEDVLPEFREIVEQATEGLILEPKAVRMVANLLRTGSRAILEEPPSDRDQLLGAAKADLAKVVHSAVGQLHQRRLGVAVVDAESLGQVMELNCPFPPFCPVRYPGEAR